MEIAAWSPPVARSPSRGRKLSLALHKITPSNSNSDSSSPSTTSRSTTPTSSPHRLNLSLSRRRLGDDDVPTCPQCTNTSQVVKLRFWTRMDAYIYVCGAETTGANGHGTGLCGRWFVWQDRVLDDEVVCSNPRCQADRSSLRIEVRQGKPGHWCVKCDAFA